MRKKQEPIAPNPTPLFSASSNRERHWTDEMANPSETLSTEQKIRSLFSMLEAEGRVLSQLFLGCANLNFDNDGMKTR